MKLQRLSNQFLQKDFTIGGFKYKIHLYRKSDHVIFDIFDLSVLISGKFQQEIIASGKIDSNGYCHINNIYCDYHASKALGSILERVYESLSEIMDDQ